MLNVSNAQKIKIDQLVMLENNLVIAAAGFKLILRRAPPSIRLHLQSLSIERLEAIESNLSHLLNIFIICGHENIDPWSDVEFLKLSMQTMHLSFPKDFQDHIQFDDLIEGYDSKRMQIFRNMRFMECSNYSLLEIVSFDWTHLFDRAQAITDKMITFCDETLWTQNRTISFDVPVHFMRELKTKERGLFEVQFRRLAPLFSGPNQAYGILGSSRVAAIELPLTQDNVAFL